MAAANPDDTASAGTGGRAPSQSAWGQALNGTPGVEENGGTAPVRSLSRAGQTFAAAPPSASVRVHRGSIAIQRLPSSANVQQAAANAASLTQPRHRAVTVSTPGLTHDRGTSAFANASGSAGRRRPVQQAPLEGTLPEGREADIASQPLAQSTSTGAEGLVNPPVDDDAASVGGSSGLRGLFGSGRRRAATTATAPTGRSRAGSIVSQLTGRSGGAGGPEGLQPPRTDVYDNQVSDLLDALDPEVQVLNTLGDIQNTWFIPATGLFDRTRKIQLTRPPATATVEEVSEETLSPVSPVAGGEKLSPPPPPAVAVTAPDGQPVDVEKLPGAPVPPPQAEAGVVESPEEPVPSSAGKIVKNTVNQGKYFVISSKLVDMSDWTEEEKEELDDYVRHLLHSRKERFRRGLRGFGKYVRTRELYCSAFAD